MAIGRFCSILFVCLLLEACNSSNAVERNHLVVEAVLPDEDFIPTTNTYSWLSNYDVKNALVNRITVPKGFTRIEVEPNSFADWLRYLPLKPGNPDVHLYNGELKRYQSGHAAVLDIDVGTTDLQQCADAVIRLRAEYLFKTKNFDKIKFHFTSGDMMSWNDYKNGVRAFVNGNSVSFRKTENFDDSYENFRK